MADYTAVFRTSYFKPRDLDKFKAFLNEFGLPLWKKDHPVFGELVATGDYTTAPNTLVEVFDDAGDLIDEEELDFIDHLHQHIADGWLVEVHEVGHEKLRYLSAYSAIVHPDGKIVVRGISDAAEYMPEEWDQLKITFCEN